MNKRSLRADLTVEAYQGWDWLASHADTNKTALIEGMGLVFAQWQAAGGPPDEIEQLSAYRQATSIARMLAGYRLLRAADRPASPDVQPPG